MTDHLHPQRESYPFINVNDELVMVFRSHIPAAHSPTLYIKGLTDARFRVDESRSLDERAGFQVLSFAAGTGDTISLTVNGGGATVLTEGVDFDAVVSNAETALQIAAAINTAAIGLTATTEAGQPFVYVAPTANSGVETFTLASSDTAAWTPLPLAFTGTVRTLITGQTLSILLPVSTDPLKTVIFLRMLSGRVSADLRSPVEVRTYLRQPATLSPNTGHAGGWPTTP